MRTFSLAVLFALAIVTLPRVAKAAHEPHSKPVVQVGIVLFDGVEIIDFTGPYEVFGQAGFGVSTVSHDGKPVETAMGLIVTPDHAFADAPKFDVLLVPGGDVHDAARDEKVLAFIRARTPAARHVLSVCTGSLILGATGLLDGLQATTFHRALDGMRENFPKVNVITDVRWADNGKLITSAGLSSGIDASLHVVAKLHGEEAARSTALQLEYDWKPEGGFVRTRMADRYLPRLNTVAWPADTHFHQLIAIGDENVWRQRFHVKTSATPNEIVKLITDAVDAIGGWTRDKNAPTPRWHDTIDGRAITLAFATAESGDGKGFELEATIAADGKAR